ncbi:MAG: SpoIIE family protein phosphatase [Desulfobacterales bacterium]|nr:SpoIIE family protein phosphatase [Desulfobacterales bacterium]
MFTSLQSKIVSLIIFIMVITALILIFIANKEIGNAMLIQQDKLSRHVLSLIDLNIKGEYNNLITDKIDAVTRHKALLRNRTDMVVKMLDQQNDLITLQSLPPQATQTVVLDWIARSGISKFGSFFVADPDLTIISHAQSDLVGVNIGGFIDMKRKTVAEVLNTAVYDDAPIINVVNWEGSQTAVGDKVLLCMQRYTPWNWIVGTMVSVDTIEVEAQQKLSKIIATLNETFEEITVAQTGFAFLFDESLNILAITDDDRASAFKLSTNSLTGNLLLQDMMAKATHRGDGFLSFESDTFEKGEMVAYISYFKPLGWYIGITVPVSEIMEPVNALTTKQSALIAVILFLSILFTAWLVSRISKPLNILATRVKEFSDEDLTREDAGEDTYIETLAHQYKDEVGRLAQSFVFMKKELRDNIRKLIDTTAENERINGELNVAKSIQLGLLPKIFPPFPERSDLGIYASLEPAKEVGGDLYDFYFVDDNKLCFTIGDVSGKGVPASLMMAITKTLIKTSSGKHENPSDIMIEVNDAIASDNPQSLFVTLFIAILDLDTGKIAYSNGGHNPPILISRTDGCRYIKENSGPVVGIMDEIPYKPLSLTLAPGDALFLYTDGVTEAQNPAKEFYTDETLLEKISALADNTCEDTVLSIKSDLKTFADVEPQFDDIAMLMVRYRGEVS